MVEMLKAVETGSVAIIMTVILVLVVGYFLRELKRIRSSTKSIIEKIEKKYEKRIEEYKETIKEKDELINEIREETQDFLVQDVEIKTKLYEIIKTKHL